MARKKKPDPRVVNENEKKGKALVAFEKNYQRMRRALGAMEKARKAIARADRNIKRYTMETFSIADEVARTTEGVRDE